MDRAEKRELVDQLRGSLANAGVIVVAHYTGLPVSAMTRLRRQMKDAGGVVKVAKNRLIKLALDGTDAERISGLMQGPTCIAFSEDPVAAPKVVAKFAKENDKFVILGGAMGTTVLDPYGVKSLAELPSLDELRGKIVGLIQAPASKVARVVQAPAGQLARVFAAYAKTGAAA